MCSVCVYICVKFIHFLSIHCIPMNKAISSSGPGLSLRTRKFGLTDTAFDHNIHDYDDDDRSDEDGDDSQKAEIRSTNFEFTNNYNLMRLLKLFLWLEVMGLILDNPEYELSVLFELFNKGVLYYVLHFYSRPFIDLIYIIQTFIASLVQFIYSQTATKAPDDVELTYSRKLVS